VAEGSDPPEEEEMASDVGAGQTTPPVGGEPDPMTVGDGRPATFARRPRPSHDELPGPESDDQGK
jgi:hypothetical protein